MPKPVAKIPDDVGDADAAALPTAGLTALAALEALHVGKGTMLLVLGATGGVGSFAVQMARDRGARVIGTAREANERLARSLGVVLFVAYDRGDVVESVRAAHAGGVDAVLDLVDDYDRIKRIAEIVQPGGRLVLRSGGQTSIGWPNERLPRPISLWPRRWSLRTRAYERCWSCSSKGAFAS